MDSQLKQEVLNLLPWYHLGKLTDEQNLLIEKALKEDPTLEAEAVFEKQMIQQVTTDKTLLDGSIFNSATSRLDNVLAQIDQLEQPAMQVEQTKQREVLPQKPNIFSQLKDYFDNLLSGNSHSFTYAVFAALTVVQLALLVLFIVPSDNMNNENLQGYELASYTKQTDQPIAEPIQVDSTTGQMVLLIGMDNHFKIEGFNEILGKNVDIDILPDNNGFYRVRLNKQLSEQEIEELKHELSKKHGKIWFIGEEISQ